MRKATLIAIALLLPAVSLLASPVKKSAAKATATAFLQKQVSHSNGAKHAPRKLELVSAEADNSPYYVFNNQNGEGFAIVSGDDTVENPILGYSTEGNLSEENMPEALRDILADYATVVEFAQKNGLSMKRAPRKADRQDIAHFVNFAWNQSGKYSENCPADCSTGCMAVTMGMIVAYYKYPETLPAVWNNNVTEQVSNEAWSPNYSGFLSSYGSYSSVGDMPRFMRHVADALNTNYSTSGSGAQGNAFVTAMKAFGYDPAMRTIMRDSYSQADWDDIVYAELAARRPVFLYGDHNQLGGHSYLVDGYRASDGFFYVNWGWGGTCNGWFDMGILNPFVDYFESWSGMGYTCPPAGFTGGLKAVIGIQQKPEGEVEEAVELLTCENMRQNGSAVQAEIFNRNGNNYTGAIRWAVLNADETFTLIEGHETTLTNFNNYIYVNLDPATVSLPGDGTYRLVPVSKKSEETEWHLCNGYKQKYIDITLAGSDMTVEVHPVRDVVVDNVSYYGTTGSSNDQYLEYVVTMSNHGDDVYNNILISGVRSDGTKVGGSSMYIGLTAGQTKTFSLFVEKGANYSSLTDPTYELTIKYNNEVIWTGNVTTSKNYANYTTYTGVDFEDYEYVDGKAMLYSTALKGSVKIKNENSYGSSYYIFNEPILITLKDEAGNVVNQTSQQYILQKKEEKAYPVNFEGLQSGKKYYLTVQAMTSTRSGSTYTYKVDKEYFADFEITVKAGVPYYTENGKIERQIIEDETTKVDLPANTAAVDFRKFGSDLVNLSSITNENCVYVFNAGDEVPAELEGKNVVVGDVAETITLAEGKPIAFPTDFTATEISYTRTFTVGNNGDGKGWQTIVLPFSAKVSVDGKDQPWFKSDDDSGLKFWLYRYTGSIDGTVYFDYETASQMTADEPYIISVPGDAWGPKYDLTNKEFTFSATNAQVKGNVKPEKTAGFYILKGTYGMGSFADAYLLNADGDFFELTAAGEETPFHAIIMPKDGQSGGKLGLGFEMGELPTAINGITVDGENKAPVFDLQGRRIENAQKGLYIRNGKKVVIK